MSDGHEAPAGTATAAGRAPAGPRRFAEVTGIEPAGDGRFAGSIDPAWTILDKPNGGYLLAMLARAATWAHHHDHVVAASAHYLRVLDPGPVMIRVEPLRSGRSASQVRARIEQGGRACVEALLTTSHVEMASAPVWQDGVPAIGEAGYEQARRLLPRTPDGGRVALLEQVDLRVDAASAGFTVGRPSGSGELRGWLSLPDGEAFDPISLLFAVDAFPPATFEIRHTGWVPTLELTAYVRAVPAPGPVRVLQRAQLVDDGRVDEACFVWDSAGRLVAQATQLAAIRL